MTGDQIREARRARGMSQPQLAGAVGVSTNCVGEWERCRGESAAPRRKSQKWAALLAFFAGAPPKGPAAPHPTDVKLPVLPLDSASLRKLVREIVREELAAGRLALPADPEKAQDLQEALSTNRPRPIPARPAGEITAPHLETAGPEHRAKVRAAIEAAVSGPRKRYHRGSWIEAGR